jgi:hypothetical protein
MNGIFRNKQELEGFAILKEINPEIARQSLVNAIEDKREREKRYREFLEITKELRKMEAKYREWTHPLRPFDYTWQCLSKTLPDGTQAWEDVKDISRVPKEYLAAWNAYEKASNA